jgi:RNA 2',3'-cyclic 3'-phosphodiesterase
MRIFIALDIPAEIRARITEYMDRARGYAPQARWARPEGLHVTLKFVGEVSDAKVQEIKDGLAVVKAQPFEVKFSGAGFFPTAKSPRVFWIGVEGGAALAQLARAVDNVTHQAGIAKEERAFSPHLTLARAAAGSGSTHQLRPLQYLLEKEAAPQFGTMTAQEFWLYRSELARGGSKYTKLERFGIAAGS